MELVYPSAEYIDSILSYKIEFNKTGEEIPGSGLLAISKSPYEFLFLSKMLESKETSPLNLPPSQIFFLVDDNEIIGMLEYRKYLENYYFKEYGGNISYSIRPSKRGNGYSLLMLEQIKSLARLDLLDKLLVTVDSKNHRAISLIERAGGIFESTIDLNDSKIRRYWLLVD